MDSPFSLSFFFKESSRAFLVLLSPFGPMRVCLSVEEGHSLSPSLSLHLAQPEFVDQSRKGIPCPPLSLSLSLSPFGPARVCRSVEDRAFPVPLSPFGPARVSWSGEEGHSLSPSLHLAQPAQSL